MLISATRINCMTLKEQNIEGKISYQIKSRKQIQIGMDKKDSELFSHSVLQLMF